MCKYEIDPYLIVKFWNHPEPDAETNRNRTGPDRATTRPKKRRPNRVEPGHLIVRIEPNRLICRKVRNQNESNRTGSFLGPSTARILTRAAWIGRGVAGNGRQWHARARASIPERGREGERGRERERDL